MKIFSVKKSLSLLKTTQPELIFGSLNVKALRKEMKENQHESFVRS